MYINHGVFSFSSLNKVKAKATIGEIEAMGKPTLLGSFNVTADELKKLKTLAKKHYPCTNTHRQIVTNGTGL